MFNYFLYKKRQTYLPTPFIKSAGLQGLSGTVSAAAQKSKEKLSQQEDSIKMNQFLKSRIQ